MILAVEPEAKRGLFLAWLTAARRGGISLSKVSPQQGIYLHQNNPIYPLSVLDVKRRAMVFYVQDCGALTKQCNINRILLFQVLELWLANKIRLRTREKKSKCSRGFAGTTPNKAFRIPWRGTWCRHEYIQLDDSHEHRPPRRHSTRENAYDASREGKKKLERYESIPWGPKDTLLS